MKTAAALLIYGMAAMVLCGCAGTWRDLQQMLSSPADNFRAKARDFENRGQLRRALLSWRIVAELQPQDAEAAETVQQIESRIAGVAGRHYRQGVKDYRSGDYPNALRNFLITLRYQPGHKKARYYLKTRLQNKEQATYEVQPGDAFIRIASKIYNDPSKAYIIAYFNDLNPRRPLLIGTTLLLPALDSSHLQPRANIKALLEAAQTAYASKQYRRVLSLTRQIEAEVPEHSKARRLADAARFDQGKRLLQQKRYLAALAQFKQVSPGYPGRDPVIAAARTQINQLAVAEKLNEAQAQLQADQWQSAFNMAEEILAHDPGNAQARMLLSNAGYHLGKQLLERGNTIRAADLLGRIDPAYENTGELLSLARARMRAQAETHYRDGVKHFINEDLESAIKDWEAALALNPEHPKARQDIDNARRLLDKLRGLESRDTVTPPNGENR